MHYAFEKCPMIQDTYDWIMFEWLNAERLKALNPETTRLCGSARSAWEYGQEKKKGVQADKLLQTDVWYDKGSEADVTRSMEAKSGTTSLAMPRLLIRHIPCQNHSLKGTSHKPQTTWLEQKRGAGREQIVYVMSQSWHTKLNVPWLRHQSTLYFGRSDMSE